jgi:tRNA(His) 5'-end guanylyltransferase
MTLYYPPKAKTFNILGDEQKKYESNKLDYFIPHIPIVARLDGKAFHKFTRGLKRPIDSDLMECMKNTCIELCKYFQADFSYTQSDEITLIWFNPTSENLMFNGRVEKYTSLLSSVCTAHFNNQVQLHLPLKSSTLAFFDARVFQVPNIQKAFENICWRQLDCIKNSISSYAYANFSSKALIGKHSKDRKGMLYEKGIDWEAEPSVNKYGTFIHKVKYFKPIESLQHKTTENIVTHSDGTSGVYRNEYRQVPSEHLNKIDTTQFGVYLSLLFSEGAIPDYVIEYTFS